jgi:BirA family biotin operon repressor/biotin-[acetyl-CoA-carboxylase] ligase
MHRPLTEKDLFPNGPLNRLGRQVLVLDQADSTNAVLLAQAAALADGTVAVADYQTAGRGRHGRRWTAPRGSSILLSLLLIESGDSPLSLGGSSRETTPTVPHAAMLTALAACEAIDACTDCQPALRWPNDLALGGKKLGGVLAESTPIGPATPARPRARALVIGVGINCLQQPGHFQGELADKATSLEIESAQPIRRAALARELLRQIDARLVACARESRGWEQVRTAWKSRCDDLGARVTLQDGGQPFTGTVLDITADGDLLVQLDRGGRRHFGSATTTRLW